MANRFDEIRNEKLNQSGFSVYAWMYRITLDALIEAYRRQSRGPRDLRRDVPWPEASAMQLGMGLLGGGTSPSNRVVREELRDDVRKVLSMLKDEYRDILWIRHIDQLDYHEIAEVLKISENNAMARHLRVLKKFKELWKQLQHERGSILTQPKTTG